MSEVCFADRDAAGRELGATVARHLGTLGLDRRPLVLALPRGGVPVAARVAETIGGDLGLIMARKVTPLGRPEYGIGAIAEDGPPVFDQDALRDLGLREADLADTVQRERAELLRRVRSYRGDRPAPDPAGRVVVVVDDGVATGVTARAALLWLRQRHTRLLVLAAPVCSREADHALAGDADLVICLHRPARFAAVSAWYTDFTQLSDADVTRAMADRSHSGSSVSGAPPSGAPPSGGPPSGGPPSGGPVSGDPVSGDPVSGGALSGGPVSGAPPSGGPVSGGALSGGPVSGGARSGGTQGASSPT